jgi:hypothetical protein
MMPDITDIQALNPYSYCLNNPLKYTYPTGHSVKGKKIEKTPKDQLSNGCVIPLLVIFGVMITVVIVGFVISIV